MGYSGTIVKTMRAVSIPNIFNQAIESIFRLKITKLFKKNIFDPLCARIIYYY